MTVNTLPDAFGKLNRMRSFRLGTTVITNTPRHASDFNTIVMGVILWFGILLDYNHLLSSPHGNRHVADSARSRDGRMRKAFTVGLPPQGFPLEDLLVALDDLADVHLNFMRECNAFKGLAHDTLWRDILNWKCSVERRVYNFGVLHPGDALPGGEWLKEICGHIAGIVSGLSSLEVDTDAEGVLTMSMIRQVSCFLKKMSVDRPDLKTASLVDFHENEDRLAERFYQGQERPDGYRQDILDMRKILSPHIRDLDWSKFVPCHGKGAVADSKVKDWFTKYQTFSRDERLAYLLGHSGLGTELDYSPFAGEQTRSSRTSRFISVPKTWKKLRGISAEPAELQFWQQGLSAVIDAKFRSDIFWRMRVDLHDQTKSQSLALSGSKTGYYATVDLQAASDSVSLQLVRDVFGNSELGRWLLGTRSVYTVADDLPRKLYKFAPMGSCTCFPVECIIFALAAELAVLRTQKPSSKRKQIRVYGDDIIVPTYAHDELVAILDRLGFTVNVDKSFHTGGFRESCGAEGWLGVDIVPVRYKQYTCKPGATAISSEDLSRVLALSNGMFMRGLHETREFLLSDVQRKYVNVKMVGSQTKRHAIKVPAFAAFFATFSGANSTLASPMPTNFHLRRKFDADLTDSFFLRKRYQTNLQTHVYEVVRWKLHSRVQHVEESLLSCIDACRLVEWLLRHPSDNGSSAEMPLHYEITTSAYRRASRERSTTEMVESVTAAACLLSRDALDAYPELKEVIRSLVCRWLRDLIPSYEDEIALSFDAYDRTPIGSTLVPFIEWTSAPCFGRESITMDIPRK